MNMYQTYPNQRMVTIHREAPVKGSGEQFLSIYTKKLAAASRELSGEAAFKLYIYFCSNQDEFCTFYSPQHFAGIYGISAESGRRAFLQLLEKGYLIDKGNNQFEFNEEPQLQKLPELKIPRRKLGDQWFTYTELKRAYSNYTEEDIKAVWEDMEKEAE